SVLRDKNLAHDVQSSQIVLTNDGLAAVLLGSTKVLKGESIWTSVGNHVQQEPALVVDKISTIDGVSSTSYRAVPLNVEEEIIGIKMIQRQINAIAQKLDVDGGCSAITWNLTGSFRNQLASGNGRCNTEVPHRNIENEVVSIGVGRGIEKASDLGVRAPQRNKDAAGQRPVRLLDSALDCAQAYKDQPAGEHIAVAGQIDSSLAGPQSSTIIKCLRSICTQRQSIKAEAAICGGGHLPEDRAKHLHRHTR